MPPSPGRDTRYGRLVIGAGWLRTLHTMRGMGRTVAVLEAGDGSVGSGTGTATDAGEQWSGRWLVMAVGNLSTTKAPEFPGQESFGGEILPTATWPHEGRDLAGKRVGITGTGSSGMQMTPAHARDPPMRATRPPARPRPTRATAPLRATARCVRPLGCVRSLGCVRPPRRAAARTRR